MQKVRVWYVYNNVYASHKKTQKKTFKTENIEFHSAHKNVLPKK